MTGDHGDAALRRLVQRAYQEAADPATLDVEAGLADVFRRATSNSEAGQPQHAAERLVETETTGTAAGLARRRHAVGRTEDARATRLLRRPPVSARPGRPTVAVPRQPGVANARLVPERMVGCRPVAIDDSDAVPLRDFIPIQAGSSPGDGYQPSPAGPDLGDAAEVWGLIERAQAGDSAAFGLLYDRFFDTVFRFVYFRVGNRELAEDLTADTFLRALKRIGRFTWQGRGLGAWLVTIARNLVANHFKSGRYRLEVTTGDVLDADRPEPGPEGNPEAAVIDHITNVALRRAVKQLNPELRECIVLRFLHGFSVAETAQAMNKNEGAIKALQYRAVRALARLLPEGFQP